MARIAIVDDNEERCQSLAMLVNWADGLECCGVFENAEGIVEKLELCEPDIVLMDINMPGQSGIEAVKEIRQAGLSCKVLMQTVFDDDNNLFSSIIAGADGYILKKSSPQQTIQAIYDCLEGGAPLTSALAKKMLNAFKNVHVLKSNKDFGLSDREEEILRLLVKGNSYKMIANECFISPHTVNAHIKKIYQKLHVHSVSEAVAKALNEGIV